MNGITRIFWTLLLPVAALAAPKEDPLFEPERAFRPTARLVAGGAGAGDRHGIDVEYAIAPGYYLYRDRLRFEVVPATLLLGPAELPPGEAKEDIFVGKSVIFRDRVVIHLPFTASVVRPGSYRLRLTAQGCAEERFCYSPFTQELPLNIPPGYRMTDSPMALPIPRR